MHYEEVGTGGYIAPEILNGKEIKLSEYKENAIMVVNVASYCGFTKQYEDLQNLWEKCVFSKAGQSHSKVTLIYPK